jgi:hypothetical protein
VDGLACSLHCPTVCSHQRVGRGFLISAAPSCHATVRGVVFLGNANLVGLDILRGVDRLGTCKNESYMEKPTFTRTGFSNVRVIMVIMRVP